MIDSFNLILKHLFETTINEVLMDSGTNPLSPAVKVEVRFDPPVSPYPPGGGSDPVLNVFLVDLRENRRLRRSDRIPMQGDLNGSARETQSPLQLDCHYLVSAWGRFAGEGDERVQQEHQLLYHASGALLRHNPLSLNALIGISQFQNFLQIDSILRDREIPLDVLPPEGFQKLADFWGRMGTNAHWKPVIYFVATLPVERRRRDSGFPVRSMGGTLINRSGAYKDRPDQLLSPDLRQQFFLFGGRLLWNNPGAGGKRGIPRTNVSLECEEADGGNEPRVLRRWSATTDSDGKFVMGEIPVAIPPVPGRTYWLTTPNSRHPVIFPPDKADQYDFFVDKPSP